MKPIYFFIFYFLFFISSCNKEKTQEDIPVKKTGMNTYVKHSKKKSLNKTSIKEIKDWKEYFILNNFIKQLENTTPTETLNNALELKTLTKHLKDSLNIKELKTPAFKARMNVFENEVLRLADMTYIPSITSKNVNAQITKVLALYSGMNEKINTLYVKRGFDKAIKLDSIFNFK